MNRYQREKVLQDFDLPTRVAAVMTKLGGTALDETMLGAPIVGKRWILHTQLGPLSVAPYDDWIACRFEDAASGVSAGATSPSGKWNWNTWTNAYQVGTNEDRLHMARGPTEAVGMLSRMLVRFEANLIEILPPKESPT